MDRTNKTFDAVKMVRAIRDKHHEQFRERPLEERLAYYRKKANEFRERLDQDEEDETVS
jgi:hypothetical protein